MIPVKLQLIFYLLLLNHIVLSNNIKQTIGSRSKSMGNVSSVFVDSWAAFNNQAALSFHNKFSSGVFYENKYLLDVFNMKAIFLNYPTEFAVLSINYAEYGDHEFIERIAGLSISKKLSSYFSASLQLDYIDKMLIAYSVYKPTITFEIGLMAKPTKKLNLGIHIFNPTLQDLYVNGLKEPISSLYKMGISYQYSKELRMVAEINKSLNENLQYNFGLEYSYKKIKGRLGVSTLPMNYHFGIGCLFGKIEADIGIAIHQVLGKTPSISLSYDF